MQPDAAAWWIGAFLPTATFSRRSGATCRMTLTSQIFAALQAHPKRVAGTVGALLLGAGVTAFGIAPLAPDASDLPVRQVLESVSFAPPALTLTPLDGVADALVLYRHDFTRRDDTVATLLQRLGVSDMTAANFIRQSFQTRDLLTGRPSKLVQVQTDGQKRLLKMSVRWPAADERSFRKIDIERHGNAFLAKPGFGDLKPAIRMASGTIQTSLFATTDALGMPDTVATQLADIFSGDIDFRRDLRKGDRFAVVYESLEADGEPLRAGRILSAEFVNDGKAMQSIWFQEPGSKGGYYTFDGQSKRRSYLAAPLAFSRVSSGYGMRFHPVMGGMRAHLGVDYAAPTGTPVMAVGDGVVEFAGWQNGYGNFIVLQHRNGHTTAYGHLSRIGVKKGQRVEQGSVIGAVGSTGVSTGPHLHFEFREQGVHKDPLLIAKQGETVPVSAASRAAFDANVKRMRLELAAAAPLQTASAQ